MQNISDTNIEYSRLQKFFWNIRVAIGKQVNQFVKPASDLELVEKRALVMAARSPGAKLSEGEIARLRRYMLDVQDRELRRDYFISTPIERTFQGLLLPIIELVLNSDSAIKTVANVGASYAHVDNLLAQRYPSIDFIGVDFAANLAEYNSEFNRENLKFESGYAMEMLEQGRLKADVFFFGNAAYEIKNLEIRRYFELFRSSGAKYVVLNEPIYPLPGGAIVDPMSVSVEESKPVYSHQGIGVSRHGPLGRVHNYKGMLEEAGFEVIHYHAFRPDFTDLRVVHVIGKGRDSA
jgi:hypothetical protein